MIQTTSLSYTYTPSYHVEEWVGTHASEQQALSSSSASSSAHQVADGVSWNWNDCNSGFGPFKLNRSLQLMHLAVEVWGDCKKVLHHNKSFNLWPADKALQKLLWMYTADAGLVKYSSVLSEIFLETAFLVLFQRLSDCLSVYTWLFFLLPWMLTNMKCW